MSAAEVAGKILPNFAGDIAIDSNRDVEVLEVRVDRFAMKVSGMARNNTSHPIAATDGVFSLTNLAGSQVGAVNGHIENLAPKCTKGVQFSIQQPDCAFVV